MQSKNDRSLLSGEGVRFVCMTRGILRRSGMDGLSQILEPGFMGVPSLPVDPALLKNLMAPDS